MPLYERARAAGPPRPLIGISSYSRAAMTFDQDRGTLPPDAASFDTLIIGAGPAGLTAGYLLSKAGKPVVVLEQDPTYVGGISRTAHYKNFLFDIGGHRFFS